MTRESDIEEQEPVSVVASFLKSLYKDKERFVSDVIAELGAVNQMVAKSVSARESYENNIRAIVGLGLEKEFARTFLDDNSLEEWVKLAARAGSLNLYSKNELVALSEVLRDENPGWVPDSKTKGALIVGTLRQFDDKALDRAIATAIERKLVEPIVTGNGFVLGPLGIMKLHVTRNWESELLIDSVLDEFIGPDKSYDLAKAIPLDIDEYALTRGDPLLSDKVRQLIISRIHDTLIFDAVGKLIAGGVISVTKTVSLPGNAVLSPFGIIAMGDNPVDDLADVVVRNVSEATLVTQLQAYNIPTGDLRQGVAELCFREKPYFFRRFFGLDQLKSVGEQLGVANMDKVIIGEEEKLWEAIMARLGFSVPTKPTGITAYSGDLKLLRAEVAGMASLPPASIGTRIIGPMMRAYAMCERVLKDLVYFYSVVIWDSKNNDELETEEVNGWIAEKLQLDDNTGPKLQQNRLTFGEWLGLLRLLDNYARAKTEDGALARENLKMKCNRKSVLAGCRLKVLDNASAARNLYRHDAGKPIPSVKESLEILDSTATFLTCLVNDHVYPTLMRIVREVTDEFGLDYYEIEEESGATRLIQGREDLSTGIPLVMPSEESMLTKDTPIIELFWRQA